MKVLLALNRHSQAVKYNVLLDKRLLTCYFEDPVDSAMFPRDTIVYPRLHGSMSGLYSLAKRVQRYWAQTAARFEKPRHGPCLLTLFFVAFVDK